MRHAVMLLFVVPQAISLLMCCCTLGTRPSRADNAAIPVAEVSCQLCCHELPPDDPKDDHLGRPIPGCPCRQMMLSLLIGMPGTVENGTTVEPILQCEPIAIDSTPWRIMPIHSPASAGEIAFHPPDHRQRYHHVLRC